MSKKSSAFKHKPIPWMYSTAGSVLAMAVMKWNPTHRSLSELEITNVGEFFKMDRISAFWLSYWQAMKRVLKISKLARQDYYALQRAGCFAVNELPAPQNAKSERLPILIVPGLNTPSVFFREMHCYFTEKGYYVSVLNLPENGFADVAASAEALEKEVARIQAHTGQTKVNIVGHCLGGLVAHYWLETKDMAHTMVDKMISLGTGYMGAQGVQQLKNLWIPRNLGKPVPRVFDELIQANMNFVRKSTAVVRHNVVTVWDFMVHFKNAILDNKDVQEMKLVYNHIIEDPDIDHLTLALNHKVFARMEKMMLAEAAV